MHDEAAGGQSIPLSARSPYELRVHLGDAVPEADVRTALATGDMGFLHSFATGSAVDGPGIRVVAWTAGCMWRCAYCHNPDTWSMRNGMPVTVTRATEELRKYRYGLGVMSGGFTLSGGEPLMQDRFAARLLGAAHAMKIHTALDTNGYYGSRLSDAELDTIDMVLLDLKGWDAERHRQLTGMDNAPTLEFARRLAARRHRVWIRFVLAPGWSDDPGTLAGVSGFAASLGNVERVDVLPFHQLGAYKWAQLGLEYRMQGVDPPPQESVQAALAAFRGVGLRAY
jgi:pyruvate formate lyase activating enzyme